MDFETLSSDLIYHGRVFDLRQEQVRMPNGRVANLEIIHHPGAVVLLPLDEAGEIWFIRQYRHASGGYLLELPAGTTEAGEAPETCAAREIREEIGMSSAHLEKIGEFFMAPGYTTEYVHIYLATGLKPDRLPADADEFITIEKIDVEKAYELAQTGQIFDSKTLATLLLAQKKICNM